MNNCIARIIFVFIVFTLCFYTVQAQIMWQVSKAEVVKWYYHDGDEFTGLSLDTSKWLDSYPWGRTLYCNREQQYYTPRGNVEIQNGFLNLIARKESITAKVLAWESDDNILKCDNKDVGKNNKTFAYTSGMIYSSKKYQYGYYEMKFKSDAGKGLWPAFWLYAGHENDEIDIFEIKGERNSDLHVDMHCPSGCNNYKTTLGALRKNWGDYISTTSAWHDGFNVIGLEWTPEYIKWYLNGKGIAYWKGKMESPSALIANLALPSNDGPFGPGPDETTKFPATFVIDYIRIWNLKPGAQREVLLEPVLPGSVRASIPNRNSRMAKKSKPEYKKSVLKNQSIQITFSKIESNGFMVAITGKPDDDFFIEIRDGGQNEIYKSSDPKISEHHFYILNKSGNSTLNMDVNGQHITYQF